jgi:hypothetical protein
MGLTEDDFYEVNFPGGGKTPASSLDIVKPGTVIPPSNLVLDESIDEQCPHFANLVFKTIDGCYECDGISCPQRQCIEAPCEYLMDDTCTATENDCALSSLSKSVHGDIFSDDFEKMAAVFLSVEEKEEVSE